MRRMVMTFDISFDRSVAYDPGLPGISMTVELKLGSVVVQAPAKIDTGSSHCIFTRYVAQELGIEVETGQPLLVSTVTGNFLTFGHTLTLATEGFEFDSTIYFMSEEGIGRNILGRLGWLDRMVIGINDYYGILYLKQHESE